MPSVAAPPPTAPLPALPPLSSAPTPGSPLPSIVASPVTPRRPLAHRAQTFDNYALGSSPFSVAGTSPLCYVDDDEDAFAASLRAGVPSSPGPENAMQVDYPSPVDGGAFEWARPQAHAQRV